MRGAFLQSGWSGSVLWCLCCWPVVLHPTVECVHLYSTKIYKNISDLQGPITPLWPYSVKMLYYKLCRSYQNVSPSAVLVRDPIKHYFSFFWLAGKLLSGQNERRLLPIRMEWECALVSVLLACCTSPHCIVCACIFFLLAMGEPESVGDILMLYCEKLHFLLHLIEVK